MAIFQTRIFAPPAAPFENDYWATSILGHVVAPLVKQHGQQLEWFWFSRYTSYQGEEDPDCDVNAIPKHFGRGSATEDQTFPSLRLRLGTSEPDRPVVEATGSRLVKQTGCFISEWRPWDHIKDLGSDRHIAEDRSVNRTSERAMTIIDFYRASSRLTLHTLIGPDTDGHFRPEHNPGAAWNSSLSTPFHVFCNLSAVPTHVHIKVDGLSDSKTVFAVPVRY